MANETDGAALPPDAFVVRVLRPDGGIAGIGTVIGQRQIVTCAHVVNAALGQEPESQQHPDDRVLVDFPYAEPAAGPVRADVVAWVPPPRPGAAGDDIAGLLLDRHLPAGVAPARLGIEPARAGQAVRVFGYLDELGSWVATAVRGRTGGKLQLDSAQRMNAMFSGSPVFDDTLGRMVGMITETPARTAPERDIQAIDAGRLRVSWPTAVRALQRRDDPGRRELTILHVSDTQFGKDYLSDASLFDQLHQDLTWLKKESSLRPDLIVVTGDLAESGLRSEFARVGRFLAALAEAAEVPRKHVAIVPGNHDVNQRACLAYFADAFANEEEPVAPYFPKWRDYVAAFEERAPARRWAAHPDVRAARAVDRKHGGARRGPAGRGARPVSADHRFPGGVHKARAAVRTRPAPLGRRHPDQRQWFGLAGMAELRAQPGGRRPCSAVAGSWLAGTAPSQCPHPRSQGRGP
jgi:hypothetical protein